MNSTAQLARDPQAPLPTGPTGLPKQRPALAQLREALTAFHIGGVCRAVAYELLTYWSPGGDVFPSVKTLADSMGLETRTVRRHLARLERVGLWVRIGRKGQTNFYGLHLPGEAQEGFTKLSPRTARSAPPGQHDPPKCSLEVLRAPSGRSAAHSKNGVVRRPAPWTPDPPIEAVTTAAPMKGSPAPSPSPLVVLATPNQSQQHIEVMREIVQRTTAKDTSTTTEASTFNLDPDLEARMVEQDRLHHEGEKWVALSLDTPPPYRGGCPQCASDRLMGGSCDQCGYEHGTEFRPSPDYNEGL